MHAITQPLTCSQQVLEEAANSASAPVHPPPQHQDAHTHAQEVEQEPRPDAVVDARLQVPKMQCASVGPLQDASKAADDEAMDLDSQVQLLASVLDTLGDGAPAGAAGEESGGGGREGEGAGDGSEAWQLMSCLQHLWGSQIESIEVDCLEMILSVEKLAGEEMERQRLGAPPPKYVQQGIAAAAAHVQVWFASRACLASVARLPGRHLVNWGLASRRACTMHACLACASLALLLNDMRRASGLKAKRSATWLTECRFARDGAGAGGAAARHRPLHGGVQQVPAARSSCLQGGVRGGRRAARTAPARGGTCCRAWPAGCCLMLAAFPAHGSRLDSAWGGKEEAILILCQCVRHHACGPCRARP
jgi:hypothetical protein